MLLDVMPSTLQKLRLALNVTLSSFFEPTSQTNGLKSDGLSDSAKFEVKKFTFLPKMIFEKHAEFMYLRLVQDIISNGTPNDDRTGTGTLSKFGCQKVFWQGIVEELLWFIRGSTNAKVLQEKDIHIWDDNTSRDYLDRQVESYYHCIEEGDLGPVYGFQWRHFGASSTLPMGSYHVKCISALLTWVWVFPFNIASYALFKCMIAHVCDLALGDFVHVIGDAHVYRTHVRPMEEQLQKLPKPSLFYVADGEFIMSNVSALY
ncbi:thymidylate synthase 1 [Actinidia rufa]|uniref:Thymidylate synthase 1 n=1 Tax=Actinidia rufa TaxID=165716 RepID=A0A7J0D9S6_9ERIC|nr:thymidylate synthase 1 [Actinidia rufa]